MKKLLLLPALFASLVLCGCPDAKLPQAPPSAPQPKVASWLLPAFAQATLAEASA